MNDTIIAIATPVGASSIGVIRLSGPDAVRFCGQAIRSNSDGPFADRSIRFGKIVDPSTWETVDDCLVSFFRSPRSYTGEDVIEISCHGNPLILKETIGILTRLGARPARPGEFTERAYLNGRMDLTQAEAVNDLIRAHTPLSRRSALGQLDGKLSSAMKPVHDAVLDLLAQLEAAIDHADLEEEFIPRDEIANRLTGLITAIDALLKTADTGRMTRGGVALAIIGAPNTGKSSLMNLLLKEDRVIVSDIPGTTRDIVEDELNVKGVPVRLMDTAGVRETEDAIEKKGIERTAAAIENADLRIFIFDSSRKVNAEDRSLFSSVKDKKNVYILNKTDLDTITDAGLIAKEFGVKAIPFSAEKGNGISELENAVADFYFSHGYDPVKDALVTNIRQENLLRDARKHLVRALDAAKQPLAEEFIASGVRGARLSIEEIGGKTTDEAVLERIFSQFCIGK